MPVARIITEYPQESEELVRQLTAAGYTVKFTAPDEEFNDADLVVSAANVHSDFALQYAAEVAQASDAAIIVAPGVVPGSMSTSSEAVAAPAAVAKPVSERLASFTGGLQQRWQQLREERALAREQKRLERERHAMQAEELRQEAMRARAAEEARLSADRERLRLERQVREEQMRAAAEAERAQIAAEQDRIAAERERLRLQRQAQEEERRRVEDQELARRAEEEERARIAAAEREREIRPEPAPAFYPPVAPAPVASAVPVAPVSARSVVARPSAVSVRRTSRSSTMRKALVAASVVALVLMIVFAILINIQPSSPLSNGVVNNSVQEQSPFGPAHSPTAQPATTTIVHAAAPVAQPPQKADAAAPSKPAAVVTHPSVVHRSRRSKGNGDVAQDQVIIHHYGVAKRPAGGQTRAGIPRYSDQQ
ncbi:MAG: hypothetical protein ACRD3E_19250 [Terriglobales bacterium]